MKTKFTTCLSVIAAILSLLANTAKAIDLVQRYPTQLTKGDPKPENARPWTFASADIFRLSQFTLKVGEKFEVKTGPADLAIGHCTNGAVWAVLIPRKEGTLTSSVTKKDEAIANVWLRFHPSRINDLFPPDTVFADGNTNLEPQMWKVVHTKFRSSWHAGMRAMIPPPKDLIVYVDTKSGAHRFFMVDTEKQTAQYVAAFNRRPRSSVSPDSIPPVVIKTVPESGSTNVPPGEFEIKVTFSKQMMDQSWSWCDAWNHSTPEGLASPKYDSTHRTCMLKVKLEPNHAYGYWLNTERYRHFQDPQHCPAVPYLLTFKTRASAKDPIVQAAQKWLGLIDDGNYSQGWKEASSLVQSKVTEATWNDGLEKYRQPLGNLVSRKLKSEQHLTEIPGVPDGHYVLMQFETSFANKKAAIETVTFMQETNGQWKAAGYFIK